MDSSTFSLTRTGIIPFDSDIDPDGVPRHLADSLEQAYASTVEVQDNRVTFTCRFFRFGGSWNVLVPFEFGDLTVYRDARQVLYRVSIRRLVYVSTAMVGVMTVFIQMSHVWQPVLLIPIMWLWFVGGNLAIGIPRFEHFIDRAIASAPHYIRSSGSRV